MKVRFLRVAVTAALCVVLAALCAVISANAAFAANDVDVREGAGERSVRTVLMYVCGSDLESRGGMASFNLRQVLGADFSADDDVRFVVMTGGAGEWHLESSYLSIDKALLPEGETDDKVSAKYNQVWEAMGADAPANAGKMVLVDGDGITKDTPTESKDELMSDPETLKAFINYGVKNYPADRYDLILWDHGGGSAGGFAADEHDELMQMMPFSDMIGAFAHNDLTDPKDGGEAQKFDFVDFDACLMSSVDHNMALADYTDFYIASPETEPGYGQEYSGWLGAVGADPDMDTFAVGKRIVDDFYDFYDSGEGKGQDGTLAVVDLRKLMSDSFIGALSGMSKTLEQEAVKNLFYDEFLSAGNAIRYGQYMNYYDLGNFASLVSVVNMEITEDDLKKEHISTDNAYSDARIAERINAILQDEDIIYARGTDGIIAKDKIFRNAEGEVEGGSLQTSGMYIFFTTTDIQDKTDYLFEYFAEVSKILKAMPVKDDGRYSFLKGYLDVITDYALIGATGRAVDWLVNEDGVDRADLNYARVRDYWTQGDESRTATDWGWTVKYLFQMKEGGESEETKAWLDRTIKQQAGEVISKENITARKAKTKDGTGYKVRIGNARARGIGRVTRETDVEMTALDRAIREDFDTETQQMIWRSIGYNAGSVQGSINTDDIDMETASPEEMIRWFNRDESEWDISAPDNCWYAVKDAKGGFHAVAIYNEDPKAYYVAALLIQGDEKVPAIIEFEKRDDEAVPTQIIFNTADGFRPFSISELDGAYEIQLAMEVTIREIWTKPTFFLPTSETSVMLSADSAEDMSLIYTDIDNIKDIADTDGDGEVYHSRFSVWSIYGNYLNVTDIVEAAEETVVGINLARVKPGIYNGEEHRPELVYHGETLKEGVDYTWEFSRVPEGEPEPKLIDVGSYWLLFKGKGRFSGNALRSYSIILSEKEASMLVYQAEEEVRRAQEAVQALIDSGSTEGLKEAYEKLVAAQNALAEAENAYSNTEYLIDLDEREALEDRLDELEDQVRELSSELKKAKVIDISHYEVIMPESVEYEENKDGIEPEVKVSGLDPSAYRLIFIENYGIGTAELTIEGRGTGYTGSISKTFTIVPKKAEISKITVGKKKMTVKAKTKAAKTGGSEYQVRYRVKGLAKWKTVKTKKQTVTIKMLKKGKKYQVQMRALGTVGGKTYYGAWSKVKTTKKIK
ncbi:MAG: hypothetical protein IJH41_01965 [Eubacterium sp.]|nr:hypothetical protein [Eubacterium sp.]